MNVVVLLCSEVGLGVAAAVACCIKATQRGTTAGGGGVNCLPSTADVLADKEQLRNAEYCVAELQYSPFASQSF